MQIAQHVSESFIVSLCITAFAIKALCYEKSPRHAAGGGSRHSKAKGAEREAAIVRCYEISGDLTMLFLQVGLCHF